MAWFFAADLDGIFDKFQSVFSTLTRIDVNTQRLLTIGESNMTKINELAGIVTDINTQLIKVRDEILAKIAELESALLNVEIPADAQTALDELQVAVRVLDDIVPDA